MEEKSGFDLLITSWEWNRGREKGDKERKKGQLDLWKKWEKNDRMGKSEWKTRSEKKCTEKEKAKEIKKEKGRRRYKGGQSYRNLRKKWLGERKRERRGKWKKDRKRGKTTWK